MSIRRKNKIDVKKSRHVSNTINIICLAYLGIPQEFKKLKITIILLVLAISIRKCKNG